VIQVIGGFKTAKTIKVKVYLQLNEDSRRKSFCFHLSLRAMLLIIFLALAVGYWIFVGRKHPTGFPPSPSFSLPMIGDGHALGGPLPVGFEKMRKK